MEQLKGKEIKKESIQSQLEESDRISVNIESQTPEDTNNTNDGSNNNSNNGSNIPAQFYIGKNIEPDVEIQYGIVTLERGKDYTITYSINKNAGQATAIIRGINAYRGTVKKVFTIKKVVKFKIVKK